MQLALEKQEALDAAAEVLMPYLRTDETSLVAAKCMGLMAGYHARWQNAPYRIDAVEAVISSDLYNPETERKSRTFTLAGKIDVRATEIGTGSKVIFDHKTTSQDITDPNATYWRQLVIEGQASHYMLIEWLNSRKVDYALWDVVRKPSISPKLLGKSDIAVVFSSGEYGSIPVSADDLARLEADKRETPAMYAARLAHDCTVERPEWYFQRRPVPRLDAEIREYAQELWEHSQDLILARRNNRWPRNSGACMMYGSPCKFLGICSGYDTADSGNWKPREWVHSELPSLQAEGANGNDILTNSRIRTFQTCRRKHQLQYEIGIEKVEEEEKESLFFGSLFHAALEQYFLALQQQQQKGN